MAEQQTVSAETGGGARPPAPPDPNTCLCCGRFAAAGRYGQGERGKVCYGCVRELAEQLGLMEDQW